MGKAGSVLDPTGPGSPVLSGGRRDLKLTVDINRSSWFQVRVGLVRFDRLSEYAKRHKKLQKFARICKFFTKIYKFLLKISRIQLDLAKSHQIWLDFVKFSQISYIATVRFRLLGFWRSKPATRPVSISSWNQKPTVDQLGLWFKPKSGQCRAN